MIDDPHMDEDDDRLASELVLGLLSGPDRDAAGQRALFDPDFAGRVDFWRARLAPLDDLYVAVDPPASVKQRVDARLFGTEAKAGFWSSLSLWRGLAAAGLAAALVLAVVPDRQSDAARLLAALTNQSTGLTLVAIYDRETSVLQLDHVSGSPDPDHSYELWVIAGENPPASLGVIADFGRSELLVPEALRPHFSGSYTLAVSDEPAGGSPTGAPTGEVLAAELAVEI